MPLEIGSAYRIENLCDKVDVMWQPTTGKDGTWVFYFHHKADCLCGLDPLE